MTDIEEVKSRVDIAGLIGESVSLKKAGSKLKGLCPFHKEKTPSFMVSPDRQMYHCFGCGENGDIFEFVMKRESVDFGEALRMLAARAGVHLKGYSREDTKAKQRLFEANDQAANYFEAVLAHAAGKTAREYLETRGISTDTAKAFRLGYAPADYDSLVGALRKKGFTEKELVDAGVAGKSRSTYARFRNRLMVPISDSSGAIRGFTGRILDSQAKEAKYVNTPETDIYHKGRLVFNLHNAKQHIIDADSVVLVEGQMDVISAWQAGTKNIAATSGTASTEEQLRQLTRFTKVIVLAFDADDAGRKAMMRMVELVGDREIELKVVDLGEAKDPDDLISSEPAAWQQAVTDALPVIDYLLAKALESQKRPFGRPAIAAVLKAVLPALAHRSQVEQDYYAEQLAAALGVSKDSIKTEIGKVKSDPAKKDGSPSLSEPVAKYPEEVISELMLGLALLGDETAQKFAAIDERVFPESYRPAALAIKGALPQNAETTYTKQTDKSTPQEHSRAIEYRLDVCRLAAAGYEPMAAPERTAEFDRLYARLKLLWAKQHQPKLIAAIKRAEESGDTDRRNRLMEEYTTLTRRIAHGQESHS